MSGKNGEGVLSTICRYDTPKEMRIENRKIGSIYRILQVGILGVIIVSIIVSKGCQDTDEVVSAVTAKVTGVAYTNITDSLDLNVQDVTPYNRIWDPADYVIPPVLDNAFFVMTNMIITPNQTRERCAEICFSFLTVIIFTGVKTGECVTYIYPNGSTDNTSTCEIEAWCPVEYNETPLKNEAMLLEAQNFTVLIKNSIRFPKFDVERQNIAKEITDAELKTCHYDKISKPSCPVFGLDYIVQEAKQNFSKLAYQGGVIGIYIKWNCNLDRNHDACQPEYSFERLDNIRDKDASLGYNFRFGKFYVKDGIEYRTLTRAYGILFEIIVSGTAGKFDFITLMFSLGAGFAWFSIANLVCDQITFFRPPSCSPCVSCCHCDNETLIKYKYDYMNDDAENKTARNPKPQGIAMQQMQADNKV
ncbi:P2X purinoceptor 4-like [Anneissia japonica]|uniref:P2X purinoceptor 4-like n=1 Tax=Anneissia japonica TaxID=1529436 RepID=UPI001425769B|nr:P2X purinoceptor 4-like [Anneissia japonica]